MDWGSLPDLAQQFMIAAEMASPYTGHMVDQAVTLASDVWAGATHHEAMPSVDRNMQIVKMASASFGLIMSAMARSPHGVIACAVTGADTMIRLARAGKNIRTPKDP